MTVEGFYAPQINEQVFAVAQKLELTNCRMFFNLRGYHPAPGDWRLDGWDGLLDAARRHGVSIWPCLCSPPVWLMDGKAADVGYEPFPFKRELWRDSISQLAAHWKGKVCGWEWLNEIVPGKLCDDPAAEYLEFCRIGSEEARRVDPQCESILAGGLWPRNFRNALLKAGAAQYVNVLPVHYANADHVADARGDLAAVRAEHVAVWDDESAAGMSVWGMPPAEMIAETVQSAWVLERWPDELQAGCRRVVYFGGWPDAAGNWSYLLDDRQPRPVAVTLAVLASKLHEARPLGSFYLGARGVFHLFQQGGKPVLLAASAQPGGEKIELTAGSESLRLTDYQGNETTLATVGGKATVQLGATGQFIEGARLDVLLGYVMPKMVQPDGVAAARRTCQAVADQQSRRARLTFQVANLHGRALSGRILADAPATLDTHGQTRFTVAPGAVAEVEVSLATRASTPPGNYPLEVRVQYDDPALSVVPFQVNLCLTAQTLAGNFLVNDDFETGHFSPWEPGQGAVLQPSEGLGLGLGHQVLKIQATGDRWVYANQNLEHLPPGRALSAFLVAHQGSLVLIERCLGQAQVGQGVGVTWSDRQGLLEAGQGLVRSAERLKCRAVVVEIDGLCRVQRDCPADQFQRRSMIALLVASDAQQVQCVDMVRLRGENKAVKLFGFVDLPRLMKAESAVDRGITDHGNPFTFRDASATGHWRPRDARWPASWRRSYQHVVVKGSGSSGRHTLVRSLAPSRPEEMPTKTLCSLVRRPLPLCGIPLVRQFARDRIAVQKQLPPAA